MSNRNPENHIQKIKLDPSPAHQIKMTKVHNVNKMTIKQNKNKRTKLNPKNVLISAIHQLNRKILVLTYETFRLLDYFSFIFFEFNCSYSTIPTNYKKIQRR